MLDHYVPLGQQGIPPLRPPSMRRYDGTAMYSIYSLWPCLLFGAPKHGAALNDGSPILPCSALAGLLAADAGLAGVDPKVVRGVLIPATVSLLCLAAPAVLSC